MTAIQPGDRIRLPHWRRFEVVSSVNKDAVWLNDNRGGTWRFKLGRPWIKEDKRGPWTPHDGGEAPTAGAVEIRLRDERCIDMPIEAKPDWKHTGAGSDIMEWRALA